MNNFIKAVIIDNEKKLLSEFPEYKQSIQQLVKKIEKATSDGVLYGILKSSLTCNNKKKQIEDYHSKGFISSFELINRNIESIDIQDIPTLTNLVEGKKYSLYDICCMEKNYNNQVGM